MCLSETEKVQYFQEGCGTVAGDPVESAEMGGPTGGVSTVEHTGLASRQAG